MTENRTLAADEYPVLPMYEMDRDGGLIMAPKIRLPASMDINAFLNSKSGESSSKPQLPFPLGFVMHDKFDSKSLNKSGKESKSVFDFLTYSRETGFSFSYAKILELIRAIEASTEINRVSKFDNSLSLGAKQNALRQIFFAL